MRYMYFVVSALLAACVTSSTPGRSPLIMNEDDMSASNLIRVQDPRGQLRAVQDMIEEELHAVLRKAAGVLPISAVTITVIPDSTRIIPNYGIGGFSPNANEVYIYVDPAWPETQDVVRERLAHTLAHELHHAVRQRGPGYGRNLLEAMITEGLAEHFAVELLGQPAGFWVSAFPEDDMPRVMMLARRDLYSTEYNHARWFLVGDSVVPRWAGYTIGYRFVADFLARSPHCTAAALVATPARAFVQLPLRDACAP